MLWNGVTACVVKWRRGLGNTSNGKHEDAHNGGYDSRVIHMVW